MFQSGLCDQLDFFTLFYPSILFCTILYNCVPSESISDNFGTYLIILGHFGPFRTISDNFGPFQTILTVLDYFEPF